MAYLESAKGGLEGLGTEVGSKDKVRSYFTVCTQTRLGWFTVLPVPETPIWISGAYFQDEEGEEKGSEGWERKRRKRREGLGSGREGEEEMMEQDASGLCSIGILSYFRHWFSAEFIGFRKSKNNYVVIKRRSRKNNIIIRNRQCQVQHY